MVEVTEVKVTLSVLVVDTMFVRVELTVFVEVTVSLNVNVVVMVESAVEVRNVEVEVLVTVGKAFVIVWSK